MVFPVAASRRTGSSLELTSKVDAEIASIRDELDELNVRLGATQAEVLDIPQRRVDEQAELDAARDAVADVEAQIEVARQAVGIVEIDVGQEGEQDLAAPMVVSAQGPTDPATELTGAPFLGVDEFLL